MVFISARFLSLLLTALAAGVVLSHVMSRAGKVTLPGPLFITVQNTLYRGWGKKVVIQFRETTSLADDLTLVLLKKL